MGTRLQGHKATYTHNGERSRAESGWTVRCLCGWEESCHSKYECSREYQWHLNEKRTTLLGLAQRLTHNP